VRLEFYRFLSHFVRDNTLRSAAVTENWLKDHGAIQLVQESLKEQVSAMLLAREGYAERIVEVHIAQMEFKKGTVHEISDRSKFAEIEFELQLRLIAESSTKATFSPPLLRYNIDSFLSKTTNVGLGTVFNVEPQSNNVIWGPYGKQQRTATLKANVLVSIRVENGRMGNLEIESFAFTESDDPLLIPVYTFASIGSGVFQ